MAGVHRGRLGRDRGGILGVLTALRDRWGALTADFRRHYQLRLADAVRDLPLDELRDLIDHLPPHDSAYARAELGALADWTPADENLAMTVDALRNWLQFLWSQWTATEAERKRARRGKSPKTPPLLPYAIRPPEVAELLQQAAAEGAARAKPATPAAGRDGMRRMSIEELALLV